MKNCEACEQPLTNSEPRTYRKNEESEWVLTSSNQNWKGIFPAELLEGLLEGDTFLCRPCAHALIDSYVDAAQENEEGENDDDNWEAPLDDLV